MAIDNDMYSREDYGWWNDDANNTCVLLRYFINPIRFAYFTEILEQLSDRALSGRNILDVGCGGGYLCDEKCRAAHRNVFIFERQRRLTFSRSDSPF